MIDEQAESDRRITSEQAVRHRVTIACSREGLSEFFPLLMNGITIRAPVGSSVRSVLCKLFGITGDYLPERIRAVFVDGKTVGDLDSTTVPSGATVAVSGCIPEPFLRIGVGWGYGREQHRSQALHAHGEPVSSGPDDFVVLKIYNVLAPIFGPGVLKSGIYLKSETLDDFLRTLSTGFWSSFRRAAVDGKEVDAERLRSIRWAEKTGLLKLSVFTSS